MAPTAADRPEFKMRYACMAGNLAAMQMYLDGGVDIDHLDGSCSYLTDAAHNEQAAAVALLLEAGAVPNLGDPLDSALAKGNFVIADLLVSAGARVNAVSYGRPRLSRRSSWTTATSELTQWLIDQKVDFEARPEGARSAIETLRKAHAGGARTPGSSRHGGRRGH